MQKENKRIIFFSLDIKTLFPRDLKKKKQKKRIFVNNIYYFMLYKQQNNMFFPLNAPMLIHRFLLVFYLYTTI